jgi:hypothetical protein
VGSPQIAIFFVLALTCLAAPQLLHLQGTTQRDRTYIVLTLIFLAWVLLFMVSLRSKAERQCARCFVPASNRHGYRSPQRPGSTCGMLNI